MRHPQAPTGRLAPSNNSGRMLVRGKCPPWLPPPAHPPYLFHLYKYSRLCIFRYFSIKARKKIQKNIIPQPEAAEMYPAKNGALAYRTEPAIRVLCRQRAASLGRCRASESADRTISFLGNGLQSLPGLGPSGLPFAYKNTVKSQIILTSNGNMSR